MLILTQAVFFCFVWLPVNIVYYDCFLTFFFTKYNIYI